MLAEAQMPSCHQPMRDFGMVKSVGRKARKGCRGCCRGKSVEQHRHVVLASGKYSAENGREFAPDKTAGGLKRIGECIVMTLETGIDRGGFAHQPCVVDAGATPRPARAV